MSVQKGGPATDRPFVFGGSPELICFRPAMARPWHPCRSPSARHSLEGQHLHGAPITRTHCWGDREWMPWSGHGM